MTTEMEGFSFSIVNFPIVTGVSTVSFKFANSTVAIMI